jgi:catechol 2,3-dioxygenase-like lactoylglutathione lyase family enzyme
MIFGVHTILYSKKAEAVRAFFRDVLGFPSVDAGGGWLVFAAPPGELSIHPADTHVHREHIYLMCKDVKAEVARLKAKGVEFSTPISDQEWGLVTQLKLPDGERLGLYQPQYPTAMRMRSGGRSATKRAVAKKNPAGKKRARTRDVEGRKSGRP